MRHDNREDRGRSEIVRQPRSLGRGREGQALAEFVLVVPILLLLVFGIVEFGLAFRTHQIVTNTAREGARVAVLPSTGSEANPDDFVTQIVRGRLDDAGLDPDRDGVEIELACVQNGVETEGLCTGSDRFGHLSVVRVEYPFRFVILGPLVRWVCGPGCGAGGFGEFTLRTASSMRNE